MSTLNNRGLNTLALNHAAKLRLAISMATIMSLFATGVRSADATTITAAGSIVQNSIPGGGLGTGGYVFYTPGIPIQSGGVNLFPDVVAPVSFATVSDAASTLRYVAPTGTYSQLTIAGTTYDTGLLLPSSGGSGDIAIITLGATLPVGGFQIGLLGNNYNYNGVGNPTVSLTLTAANGPGFGDDSIAFQLIQQLSGASDFKVNRFYLFDVTNATPGDTITISGIAGADGALLGGITFTPEPSGFALAGISLSALIGWNRRRRHAV